MPTTLLRVERIDHSRYADTRGTFDDYLVTGIELGAHTTQFHTTSTFMASVCQRAKDLERPVSILWRDHRIGRVIVDAYLQPPPARVKTLREPNYHGCPDVGEPGPRFQSER